MKMYIKRILFFAFVISIFFHKQIFLGEVFFCCDNLLINIPSKMFLVDQVRNGAFPLWNPYIFSGTPFLADINVSALFPLNFMYFLLEPFTALTWSIVLLFGIGLSGAYIFGRSLGLSSMASFGIAVVFGFSGSMVTYTNNLPMLQVAALSPLVLIGWIKLTQRVNKGTVLLLTLAIAVQILGGHPQLVYYTLLAGVCFYVFFSPVKIVKKIVIVMGVIALSILITGLQVFPFLEFASLSTRLGGNIESATLGSVRPESLIRLFIPSIVGEWSSGTAWIQGGTIAGYVGFIPWILLFFVRWKTKQALFFGTIAIISLLLSLGSYTPVFALFYTLLPGFGSFREPSQLLFIMTLSLAVLTGFGLERLLQEPLKNKIIFRILLFFGCGTLVIAIVTNVWEESVVRFVFQNISLFPMKVGNKLTALSASGTSILIHLLSNNVLIIGFSLLSVWLSTQTRTKNIQKVPLVLFVLYIDLFLFTRGNILTVSKNVVQSWYEGGRRSVQQLDGFEQSQDRLFVYKDVYPAPVTKIFGDFNQDQESAWQFSILRPTVNMLYGIASIDGYASMVYRPYQEYFRKPSTDPTGVNTGDIDGSQFSRLATRFVKTNDSLFIYDKTRTFQRITLTDIVTRKNEQVDIQSTTANSVVLNIQTGNPSELVFREVFYPGWKAYINNKEVKIEPYDEIFQSVAISKDNKNTVRFVFDPLSVKIGAITSILGIGIWLVFFRVWLTESRQLRVNLKRKGVK